jgi:hypothetical protein
MDYKIYTHTFIPASFIYIYLAARHPGGGGNSKTAPHTDVMCRKEMTRHQIIKIYVKNAAPAHTYLLPPLLRFGHFSLKRFSCWHQN